MWTSTASLILDELHAHLCYLPMSCILLLPGFRLVFFDLSLLALEFTHQEELGGGDDGQSSCLTARRQGATEGKRSMAGGCQVQDLAVQLTCLRWMEHVRLPGSLCGTPA